MRRKKVLMLSSPIIVMLLLLGFFSVLTFLFPVLSESYLGVLTVSVTSTILTLLVTLVSQASSESLVEAREKASERRSLLQREKSEFFSPLVFALQRIERLLALTQAFAKGRLLERRRAAEFRRAPLSQARIEPLFNNFLADKLALAADSEFRRELLEFSWYLAPLDITWSLMMTNVENHDYKKAKEQLRCINDVAGILRDALHHFHNFALDYLDFVGDKPTPSYESFFTYESKKSLSGMLEEARTIEESKPTTRSAANPT